MTMETEQSEQMEVPVFQFQNNNLSNRCKDVFGCLDEIELKHKAFEKVRSSEDSDLDRSLIRQGPSQEDMETINPENSQFKHPASFSGRDYHANKKGGRHGHERAGNRQQDFKKPSPPPLPSRGRMSYRGRYGLNRGTPDHKLHPDRWTEYSLEDVDTSDSANKQAAFEFLQERKKLREAGLKEENVDLDSNACSKGQFTFKRPSKDKNGDKYKSDKQEELSLSAQKNMPDDQMDEAVDDNNVDMETVVSGPCKDESREGQAMDIGKLKRKLVDTNLMDEDNDGSLEKHIGFKNRKVSKRNIRSRRDSDDDDN